MPRMAMGEQTSLADRKRRAGQRLFIGLHGTEVTTELRAIVREIRPAGFVLFARNVVEPGQVSELNRSLCELADDGWPVLIAVDQEGGRVQRVRSPATVWPSMRELAAAGEFTGEVSAAMARELRAMGFHINFAPVADVNSNPDNPVIGDRAFGVRPDEVSEHVARFIQAHEAEGIATCAKHFPGHGDTNLDSHHDLPTVDRPLSSLEQIELPPFEAAIEAGVSSIMSAHVLFPALDEDRPATLSPEILPRLLRRRLGFDGLVFSDDMDMKAVRGRWSSQDQVVLASQASIDVFLACQSVELQFELYEALVHTQESDQGGMDRACAEALRRLQLLRKHILLTPHTPVDLMEIGSEQHRILATKVRMRANEAHPIS